MPSVTPFLKIRCPYCREKFHPGDCAIYSFSTGKLIRPAPRPGTFEYRKSRVWIDELNGPEYVSELARRQCPHCHKLLFEGIETCENINIAIVGDVASGKTHYIAVLIDLLRRGVLMQYGNGTVRLMHLNEHTATEYRNVYYQNIFVNRTVVPGTQPGHYDASGRPMKTEPLVYQLSIQDDIARSNTTINLLFYDISGEDVADHIKLVQFGEHVLRADGIIYLADPLSMTSLRQQLPSRVQSTAVPQRTAHEVLGTVLFRLEQYNRIRPEEPVSIPTAIVLSKSDLLQYAFPKSEHGRFLLMHRAFYDGKVHIEQLKRIDLEVRYCLQLYNEHSLLQIGRRFENVSFFAVSATGTAPDSNGKYAIVEPHRCLDPFIWLLWKLEYMKAVN